MRVYFVSYIMHFLHMQEILVTMADSMLLPSLKPMRTHSRNLSWGGQGTPLSRKLSASPKVASALASTASLHRRTGSLNSDLPVDVVLNFRYHPARLPPNPVKRFCC